MVNIVQVYLDLNSQLLPCPPILPAPIHHPITPTYRFSTTDDSEHSTMTQNGVTAEFGNVIEQ